MSQSSKEIVLISDIHGCLEEFEELLKLIQYNPNQMRVVLLGDLIHRGPCSLGVVRKAQELKIESVLGNHEEWHLRYEKHEQNRIKNGIKNPMPLNETRIQLHNSFTATDLAWLSSLPYKLHLEDSWWAVHAGVEAKYSFEEQRPEQLIRCRYLDKKGKAIALNKDKSKPENTTYWPSMWSGSQSIIFGHTVFDEVTEFKNTMNTCVGIETGVYCGGKLTGYFLKSRNVVQIAAKKIYKERKKLSS